MDKQIVFIVGEKTHKQIKLEALKRGLSMKVFILDAINEKIDRERKV